MTRPSPDADRFTVWKHTWNFCQSFVPHAVFLAFIYLSTDSARTVTGVAFWCWLVLAILDELLPRVPPLPWSTMEQFPIASPVGTVVKKVAILLFILFLIAQTKLGSSGVLLNRDFVLLCLTTGFLGAIFAIPIAHELMHSRSKEDRRWAVVVMAMFSYPHFCLEHMYGHHRNVGTYEDPATARPGESIYAFFSRTLYQSFLHSWRREVLRLRLRRRGKFSVSNRILACFCIVVLLHILVFTSFGLQGALFFLAQGFTGILTLEAVNYIEHYGLQRRRTERGSYEAIGRRHSWNSAHLLTNLLLFDLARHSDHHFHPAREFRSLELGLEAPRLPVGYFGILWITLFPPLWRQLMDKRVQRQLGEDALLLKEV
ncbi:alkane 1-monooxygenase [Sinorhizobium meliloti]|uniref:alkane 1-monooxygenase n=1 Tax=Rhizobium meliloti TaxID=382 RepID=UPI0013E2E39C|nr:alkane 1-monooxygenase [Sinorhizobium meliloti]